MIYQKLDESYGENLLDEIFEEVSDEALEAIEESILNELSPELLQKYKRAASSNSAVYKRMSKSDGDLAKKFKQKPGESDEDHSNRLGNSKTFPTTGQTPEDLRKSSMQTKSVADKRDAGIKRASSSLDRQKQDVENLKPIAFRKKYGKNKSQWRDENQRGSL